MRKLRILLADDHTIVRDGLAALIAAQPDMDVVAQAGDGQDAVRQTLDWQPDVAIVDVSMPNLNGIQATEQIARVCPATRVIALTRHSDPGYVRQLLQAGARGYVLKQAVAEELINAIRAVAAGETYLDTTLRGRAVDMFVRTQTQGDTSAEQELSERETNVVRLTAFGYSNKEIANQLGISVKTVDTYKARAMEKLGLHSRAGLVRYALQRGWLDQT